MNIELKKSTYKEVDIHVWENEGTFFYMVGCFADTRTDDGRKMQNLNQAVKEAKKFIDYGL
jgi:hypothetical protein